MQECVGRPTPASECVDLNTQREVGAGGLFQPAWARAVGVSTSHLIAAFGKARVPEQLRTHFARSLALLNVLWQHLVEQGKNCTAPGLEQLQLLISSQPRAFQRQERVCSRGALELPPLGWHQPCALLISAVSHLYFPKQKTNTTVSSRVFLQA